MRREFPRTTSLLAHVSHGTKERISTLRALAAGWERRTFCFICPIIVPHLPLPVKPFLKFSQKIFPPTPTKKIFFAPLFQDLRHDLRHFDFSLFLSSKKGGFFWNFFYCVSFCTKNSTKNRLFWILPFLKKRGIIYKLSAAPTPQHHAQRSHRPCGVSILWYQRASMSTVVLF